MVPCHPAYHATSIQLGLGMRLTSMRVFSLETASKLRLLVSMSAPHEEIEVVCHCLSFRCRPSLIDAAQQLFESVRQLMRKIELTSINSVQQCAVLFVFT